MLDLDDALDRLAPEVDLPASRELFDRRRQDAHGASSSQPRLGRVILLAAAVVVLLVGIGAAMAVSRPDTATLDVGGRGELGGESTAATTATEPPTVPATDLLGTVALPAVGTTGSGLLDDGTPVWVVHHPGGSVSVLPTLVHSEDVATEATQPGGPAPDRLTGTLEVITAFGDSGFRSHLVDWDPWGRTITGERELDLTGYAGIVGGDGVQVVASAVAPIPGEPQGTVVGDSGVYPTVPDPLPSTPDQVTSIATATPGWHRIADRVHLYGAEDVFRICPAPQGVETYSLDALAGCTGPVAHGISGPAGRTMAVNGDPLLVRVDEAGEIVGVALYALGGSSWDTPTSP